MIWKLVPNWIVKAMGRISYSKKFILFFIAFFLPMIIIMFILFTDIKGKIKQNDTEQHALISLQHFTELLRHTQYYRGLNQSLLRGYDEFDEKVKEKQKLVQTKIKDIDRQIENDWYGFIEKEKWNSIKTQWENVKNEKNTLNSFYGHNQLNSEILLLISNIVNEAHIYLNPEPNMNRLSNTINEDLLIGTERMGQLRAFSSRLTLQDEISEKQQQDLMRMIGGVQLFIDNFNMTTHYIEDFTGDQHLFEEKQQFSKQTSAFLDLLLSNEYQTSNPEIVFSQATSAINSGFTLYDKGNALLLDHLIDVNHSYKKLQLLLGLLFIASILFIYLLFGGAYISVIQTLHSLQKGTSKWTKGDFGARIKVDSKDELKYIGDSFNQLASSFEMNLEENLRIQEDLQNSLKKNNQLATAINKLEIGVIITDPLKKNNPITFVNAGFEKLTGYKAEEVIGRKTSPLQGEKTSLEAKQRIREGIKNQEAFSLEILNYRKDGTTFWNYLSIAPVFENGKVVNYLGLQTDITEQKKADEKIYSLAFYDQLTNLPNYNKLHSIVSEDLKTIMKKATILRLDVARFKNINHARGFTLGDNTLIELAKRLYETVKGEGIVSRQYGDKFTIYLPHIAGKEEIQSKIDNIQAQFHKPFEIDGYTFYLEAAIGVSQYPKDGTDYITLMQHAEAAMFQAKESNDEKLVYYQHKMNRNFEEEYVIENNLRVAIEKNELFLTYQPKLNLKTGEITGMEALIRWRHPELGIVPPIKFIPLAEKTGLIYKLGEWVLGEACNQNKMLQIQGFDPLVVSVNISARQFSNKDYLLSTIDQILTETDLDAKYLEIELTESVFQNPTVVKPVLEEIKKRNIKVSIDDFGTGYSSLSYLKLFPIDVLKVDRAFIKDIIQSQNDQKLTKSMIDIGHGLNLKVIAEGVETSSHIELLKMLECDEVQGYHIAKPLTADEFVEFIKDNQ
ncbi:EAL domain-containing protein [Alkalihalobacterium elongatum]|uniref:EAL domain-containing protein n=1 Tax=Alkalihalobacterium elongatum TaxID=2675466 RepID=UPI001C1F8F87|nr:EAL domain-containing protein [Alkalihalobacterium elongatum]